MGVYPHIRILLSYIKEQTTDTYNNIAESQKYYAKWKNPYTRFYFVWLHDMTF